MVLASTDTLQIQTTLGAYLDVLRDAGVAFRVLGANAASKPLEALPIGHVSCDSRDVRENTLFICKGAAFKPEYLFRAVHAGARAYVAEQPVEDASEACIPCVQVDNVRFAMSVLARAAYDHPARKLSICAFTGTKGKTTSAYYLKGLLDTQAARCGEPPVPIIATGALYDGTAWMPSEITTPEPLDLQRILARAVAAGAHNLVMEASSQALKYGRVCGIRFAVGAFTNISPDHISAVEHPDFEDYFASKLRLFAQSRAGVVNLDAARAAETLAAAQACERALTYSMSDPSADIALLALHPKGQGALARVRTPRFTCEVELPSRARFNVENALGAIACAEALGLDQQCIQEGLRDVAVPGRMELIECPERGIVGVVDYAHNAASMEALLTSLRASYPGYELCVMFGAAGGKALNRRKDLGTAAGRLADRIVITEDDPGLEDAYNIGKEISGFVAAQGNDNWVIVPDRKQAIHEALAKATPPAVVALAGKAHERYMARANGHEPYEGDAAILRAELGLSE